MMTPPPATIEDFAKVLRELGLNEDDSLIIHSSFRALGTIDFGPEGVIRTILEILGPKGNLMLPTFNYTRPLPEPYFDLVETKARTGILVETGRKWPGAVRSVHPTHSVAVIGPDAERLTQDHLQQRAFGIGSPIDRLAKMGGKVLLLGVSHTSNTMIHIGEEYAAVPKVSVYEQLPVAKVRLPDGRIVEHPVDSSPSCSTAFDVAEYILRRKNQTRDGRFGGCRMQLMRGQDMIDGVVELIHNKADIFLCNWSGCRPCTGARAELRKQGRLSA